MLAWPGSIGEGRFLPGGGKGPSLLSWQCKRHIQSAGPGRLRQNHVWRAAILDVRAVALTWNTSYNAVLQFTLSLSEILFSFSLNSILLLPASASFFSKFFKKIFKFDVEILISFCHVTFAQVSMFGGLFRRPRKGKLAFFQASVELKHSPQLTVSLGTLGFLHGKPGSRSSYFQLLRNFKELLLIIAGNTVFFYLFFFLMAATGFPRSSLSFSRNLSGNVCDLLRTGSRDAAVSVPATKLETAAAS